MANAISATEVMRSKGVATLRLTERVGKVYDLLCACPHHAFPLVDEAGRLQVRRICRLGWL